MTAPSVPILELRGVVRDDPAPRGAPAPPALLGCTMQVRPGEIVAVTGSAGAGKTTLLLVAAGRVPPSGGVVRWAGRPGPDDVRPQLVGPRPWEYGLMTVRQAVACHAERLHRRDPAYEPPTRFVPVLTRVGLRGAARHRLGALDPLDQFRVVLAQALLAEPRLLCCDEPFAFLGPGARDDGARLLRTIASDGVALLIATRDAAGVTALADRTLRLDRGRLRQALPRTQLTLDLAVAQPARAARRLESRLPSLLRRGRRLRVPLEGRSPEAILALCREAGVEVRGSQVAETLV